MVKAVELHPVPFKMYFGARCKKKVRYLILVVVYLQVPKFGLATLKLLNMPADAKDPLYHGFLEFMFSEHL